MRLKSTPIENKKNLVASGKLSSSQMERALEAGADLIKSTVQNLANAGANHRRGQLVPSIDYEFKSTGAATYAALGWHRDAIKGPGKSGKVKTVADYAGVLEYSGKRVHRHMESGFDASEGAAADAVEQAINSLIDDAIK